MDDVNPYATPRNSETLNDADESGGPLWRDNRNQRVLVMHKDASLPNTCVKSGVEVSEPGIELSMGWHNPWIDITSGILLCVGCNFGFIYPWIGVTALLGVIACAILSRIYHKKATIIIPLSDLEKRKKQNWTYFFSTISIVTIVYLFGCLAFLMSFRLATLSPRALVGACVGAFVVLVAMIIPLLFALSKVRVVRPVKITETKVWLLGVHPSIVGKLPLLPSEMRI